MPSINHAVRKLKHPFPFRSIKQTQTCAIFQAEVALSWRCDKPRWWSAPYFVRRPAETRRHTMHTDNLPRPSCLLRIGEVLRLCGMSRTTLYREIKLHNFPAPVKLSARSVGWLQEDVA